MYMHRGIRYPDMLVACIAPLSPSQGEGEGGLSENQMSKYIHGFTNITNLIENYRHTMCEMVRNTLRVFFY